MDSQILTYLYLASLVLLLLWLVDFRLIFVAVEIFPERTLLLLPLALLPLDFLDEFSQSSGALFLELPFGLFLEGDLNLHPFRKYYT